MDLLDTRVYGIIGDEGFTRLVAAFYRRVPADDLLGPMYEKQEARDGGATPYGASRQEARDGGATPYGASRRDLAEAEWRLREFLIGRFGGPERYLQKRGHPRLKMRHIPFRIDAAARDRWLMLMDAALAEVKLPPEAEIPLRQFFQQAGTFLINQPM